MNIKDMFPTKSEQRIAQRVIEILKKYPNSNAMDIGKILWAGKTQDAVISNVSALYTVLKNLQCLDIVNCQIDPFKTSGFEKDYFTLTNNSETALATLYSLHKAKPYSSIAKGEFRYVVFACGSCGSAVGARNSQKTARCTRCGYRTNLQDNTLNVLLKTNEKNEVRSTIQLHQIKKTKNHTEQEYTSQ